MCFSLTAEIDRGISVNFGCQIRAVFIVCLLYRKCIDFFFIVLCFACELSDEKLGVNVSVRKKKFFLWGELLNGLAFPRPKYRLLYH